MPTIYFDENFSHNVAAGFHSFEIPDGRFSVNSTIDVFGRSADDAAIIGGMDKTNEFLITQDNDFRRTRILTELIKKNKVGVFLFRPPRGAKYWDILHHIYRAWPNIKRTCDTKTPPFLYEFKARGSLQQLSI